jgi:hypothetical protein
VISCLTVTLDAGGRRIGLPPSTRSSTCTPAKSGQYSSTGALMSSFACSISRRAATVATILVIDMIRKRVSGPTGSLSSGARRPAAPS